MEASIFLANLQAHKQRGLWQEKTYSIQHKTTLGCMAGLTLTLVCVAAADQLVVIQ